jgi:serine/threonine protein kinase
MTPKHIQLKKRWTIGPEIGKGGFGRVFEVMGEDASLTAAAKFIPKEPGAERELLFEDLAGVRHVVPIIDSGEWEAHWVLVMPRATTSLRAHLTERGRLSAAETVAILTDIVTALSDLKGRVVHRDIKPENVLLLDGRWCLADFGIARYAEASTAVDTHKWAWSRPYNAPERWRDERATSASDIYSLGVMAFEMLTGHLPFKGPDFRDEHLNKEPPALERCPALLTSFVAECLLKAPEARPVATNVLARLATILQTASVVASHLQAANQAIVQGLSKEASMQSAARSDAERRREVVASAEKILEMVRQRLYRSILENAPASIWQPGRGGKVFGGSVKLGNATLAFGSVEESRDEAWGSWKLPFRVIAYSSIEIRIPPDRHQYEGRSHSLWFCDARELDVFSWHEAAFMVSPLIPRRGRKNPFAVAPSLDAAKALGALSEFQAAWPFTPIGVGDDDEFLERWIAWFAQAAQGHLSNPSSMPERSPRNSWRR